MIIYKEVHTGRQSNNTVTKEKTVVTDKDLKTANIKSIEDNKKFHNEKTAETVSLRTTELEN